MLMSGLYIHVCASHTYTQTEQRRYIYSCAELNMLCGRAYSPLKLLGSVD